MRQEEQEIQRSVLIQHCSLGLIDYIGIMGWILNKLRVFFGNLMDNQQINDESFYGQTHFFLRKQYPWATEYSFKHASPTELVRQGLETTKLNVFTHHNVFSKATSNYYIYAANAWNNDIASISTLTRSSIAQPLALPLYETLPVGRGIKPTDNIRARSDMIYIDLYDNHDMSRQQDQLSSGNINGLEHRRSFNKDLKQR
ncbi:MAG: hypothetical protein EZS28_048108 [Streblomastix strix]|uniref:Uncharacterized protein n=1 Tax=Streblomastix strix TaxID=222440 RepID=A0A5J4TFU0_9EUKA|nr:MAG: hypothetical protein EZS28_048108 [Streblomastix strix]